MARRSASFYEEISDDALAAYIRRIVRIPLLAKEEELRLGALIRRGDERAYRALVEANLRFVVKVAMRYRGCGLSLLDLINEGNLGLLEAARRYAPDYGVKFITYAVWWIRQAIMQALAAGGSAVRLPIRKARLASKIRGLRADLTQERQEEPSDAALAEAMHLEPGEMEDVLRGAQPHTSLSEDGYAEEHLGLELARKSVIPPVDQDLISHSFREEVERMLRHLKPRERAVIELRFGLGREEPRTLEEVGRRLKLSRERIRQIEERAKQKLRLMARTRHLKDYLN
ncbi:MAG: RNA polymerase sigma factor RpoD/SigA [candidate division NC10 bacterium]|nr:RNA polymerase sigma factor RpoD/SigA [candidate division NC10 bacterium]